MEMGIMSHQTLLVFSITCLTILPITMCQNPCPARCLCHLLQQPRTIMCSKQGLEVFPKNISDIVEHLDLSRNMLTDIPSDVNRLIDLQYLNLARNQLTYLPSDLRSLKNLRRLDLTENKIYDVININSISQLPSLAVLYVSINPLSTLEGLISNVLHALDASHCALKDFGNNSLDGLPALTTLSLAGNPLKSIQRPQGDRLRWLDLSDCHLNYLDPDTFVGFPNLEELRLANNPMLVISTRHSTLTHSSLKKLDVSRCNLDRPGIHGLPALTHIRLSRNTIRMLPDRIFAKNRQLTYLYLNANGVERLNASTFEGLVKLELLDLSANGLEEIHPLAFHENVQLKALNLSFNILFDFPSLTSAVASLDLSSNLISSLDKNSLDNMPKIRSVDLSDNKLQSIPRGFRSMTLRNLNLKSNRLVQLNNDSFLELPQLQKIDLSGNRLTEGVRPEVFRNNPDLVTMKLDDNPWRCDCVELYQSFIFLTSEPVKTAGSSLVCQSPANVSGYSWEAACYTVWNKTLYYSGNRTWGLILLCMLILTVLCGSVVSIRHTMKIKRRALEQRQQLEREEARERLRLLRRRNQHLEEELLERPVEPRINPLELIGPPSYEEALQMPRLAQSLNCLDEIGAENGTVRMMGSVDNLRAKKRRTRRPRKRTQSEDDLLKREERRRERLRRERNNSVGNIREGEASQANNQRNSKSSSSRKARRHSVDDSLDSSSARTRPRPQTPNARKKKHRHTITDGHSTDDEDSDVQVVGSGRSIVIRELRREPRSGYRESVVERDS